MSQCLSATVSGDSGGFAAKCLRGGGQGGEFPHYFFSVWQQPTEAPIKLLP